MPIDTAADFDAILFDCDGTLVDSEAPGMDVLHQVGQDVSVLRACVCRQSQDASQVRLYGMRL